MHSVRAAFPPTEGNGALSMVGPFRSKMEGRFANQMERSHWSIAEVSEFQRIYFRNVGEAIVVLVVVVDEHVPLGALGVARRVRRGAVWEENVSRYGVGCYGRVWVYASRELLVGGGARLVPP